jgi:hypothetical protein
MMIQTKFGLVKNKGTCSKKSLYDSLSATLMVVICVCHVPLDVQPPENLRCSGLCFEA